MEFSDLLILAAVVVGWYLLTTKVLPRMGVPT